MLAKVPAVLLALCGLTAGLALIRPATAIGYDGSLMLEVAEAMTRHGSFVVPNAHQSLYSPYGLAVSLLEAPLIILADHFGRNAGQWAMAVNAGVLAAILVVVLLLALQLGASPRRAVLVALIGGFATPALTYAATQLSEPATGLGVLVALLGLAGAMNRRGWGPLVAGLGAGAAALAREDSLLLVLPLIGLGLLALDKRPRSVVAFGLGLLPFLVTIAWYDQVRYGAPWRLGYPGYLIFNHPLAAGLYGYLLSPAYSLFLYAPFVFVAAVGVWQGARRYPVLVAVAVALLLVRIAFYATFWSWNGGWAWGPRYLAVGLLALVVPLIVAVRQMRWGWLAAAPLLLASFCVQVLGALWPHGYGNSKLLRAYVALGQANFFSPAVQAREDRIAFDWRNFPILDQAETLLRSRSMKGYLFLSPEVILVLVLGAALAALGAFLVASWSRPPTSHPDMIQTLRYRSPSAAGQSVHAAPWTDSHHPGQGKPGI